MSRRRRNTTPGKTMTIPELKRAFDAVESEVGRILSSGQPSKLQVKKFQESWRRIFGRPVEYSAAEAYLLVKARKGHKSANKTRKAQKGGAAPLSGAPLDFQTRPGIDGAYGSFNQYQTTGLSFYDTINQQGMFKGCGTENISAKVPESLGSNEVQKGGGWLSDAIFSATTRPVAPTQPPGVLQDANDYMLGRPLGQSPTPDQNRLRYM
jgi:hypothetical protein